MKIQVPEKAVLRACLDYLDITRTLYVRVHPVKPVSREGQMFFTPVRHSQKGAPDLLIFPSPGVVIAGECKSSKGALSAAQEGWRERAQLVGITYAILRSVEDLQMVLPLKS